jgi:hypothetical protein
MLVILPRLYCTLDETGYVDRPFSLCNVDFPLTILINPWYKLWIRLTLMRIRMRIRNYHPYADPQSTYHPYADPDSDFDLMRIRMQIRIRLFTLMRIRIRIRILFDADADPGYQNDANTLTMIGKIPISMAQQGINVSSNLKCPLAGAELVHDAAQSPHVRLGVVGPPLTQLCKQRSCDR